MVADLREIQVNQWFSENRIDKQGFASKLLINGYVEDPEVSEVLMGYLQPF